MKISGPEHFKLAFDSRKCTAKFSGVANTTRPKLYVVVAGGDIVYVGVTKRKMRERIWTGWAAKGKTGYYGYKWRHKHTEADLYVWCHENAVDRSSLDMETVEAEVAFLIRLAGQWPSCQTEIHFHPSEQVHRDLAASIVGYITDRKCA